MKFELCENNILEENNLIKTNDLDVGLYTYLGKAKDMSVYRINVNLGEISRDCKVSFDLAEFSLIYAEEKLAVFGKDDLYLVFNKTIEKDICNDFRLVNTQEKDISYRFEAGHFSYLITCIDKCVEIPQLIEIYLIRSNLSGLEVIEHVIEDICL